MPLTEIADPTNVAPKKSGKTVEQTYQKLTQHEHILQRPDTYVGSIEVNTHEMWSMDPDEGRMRQQKRSYVPGLYKIFDEILVNAADNKQRDSSMSEVRVDIDRDSGRISVFNNGKGIPVVIHKEHGIYVPELIFGHLLTSSNYDDSQKKVTGGRNGYGAKLANIFSTEFVVETADSSVGKRFKQTFRNNMLKRGEPEIKASKEDWTRISFVPDFAKFHMEGLEEDVYKILERRTYDLAGVTHSSVKVWLNGKKLTVNNFSQYVDLYLGQKLKPGSVPRVSESTERWEVAVAASDDGFQQVSFVNSIATTKGGTHVAHVVDQVVEKVLEHLKKKHKGMEKTLKPAHVKAHLKVFVNCLIENPAFDSQTKENMTLKQSAFGSKCVLSDKFFRDVLNCGVLESILSFAQNKQSKELKKTDGAKKARITGISKLDDANEAGGRNGYKCSLIITEGDSAKALAVAGLSVIGRDYYGVFPLRGKLLNVRDANHSTIMANKEISELKQILGLQQGKDYASPESVKTLRYGHLMIMTDQDHDGSHIKGLIINFLHCYWPALLHKHDFVREFVTPIVKVAKGRQALSFFTLKEYNDWRQAQASANGWNIKYYKGLGTSTSVEAKQYFSNLPLHELTFTWSGPGDATKIERAFSKSMADQRKEWLRAYDPQAHVDHSRSTLDYSTFIDKELIHFSNADNVRSIPSVVDGLKPGQRKILFSCFKRGKSMTKTEIKVAQLAGYVSEHSAYHHGEASLAGTIVGMAQTFVGSNNIALLHPAGQFGTRLLGGKDAASPRYIFTKLPALTRLIFHPADDALLDYLDDDGQSIEPKYYVPILPMVLVNGSEGIGTGWSSSVPNYNPRDIVANLRRLMADEEQQPMQPWYRGYGGVMVPTDKGSFSSYGTLSKLDETTLHISELPLRKWTQDYKTDVLEPMLQGDGKGGETFANDLREHHTETTVSFTLKVSSAKALAEAEKKGLHKHFKLSSSLSTSNMTLFDERHRIHKWETAEQLMLDFYALRLSFYNKRKLHLSELLTKEWSKLDNKLRFVLAVVAGKLKIGGRKKAELVQQLIKDGYTPFEPPAKKKATAADDDEDEDEPKEDDKASASGKGYDYLLGMPLWSLTHERVEQLRAELQAKESELQTLLKKTPKTLWLEDLEAFEAGLQAWEEELAAEAAGAPSKGKGKGKAPAKPRGKASKKAMGSDDDFDDDDFDDDEGSDEEYGKKKKKAPPKKAAAKAEAMPDVSTMLANAVTVPVPEYVPPKKRAVKPTEDAVKPTEDEGEEAAAPKPKPAPKPKAAPKKKVVSESEESMSDDDDEEEEEMPAPKVERAVPRRATAAKAAEAASKYADASGSEESEEEEDMSCDDVGSEEEYFEEKSKKPSKKESAPKKEAPPAKKEKAPPKPKAAKQEAPAPAPAPEKRKAPAKASKPAAPPPDAIELSDSDGEGPSLAARLLGRAGTSGAVSSPIAPHAKKVCAQPTPPMVADGKRKLGRKPLTPMGTLCGDDLEMEEEEEEPAKPAKPAPKPKPAPKAKKEPAPKAKKEPAPKAKKEPAKAKKEPAPKKKKAVESDDEEEDVEEEVPKPAPKVRPGRAAPKSKYVEESGSEESESEPESEPADESDSEGEWD